jgi:hypothetical protein
MGTAINSVPSYNFLYEVVVINHERGFPATRGFASLKN